MLIFVSLFFLFSLLAPHSLRLHRLIIYDFLLYSILYYRKKFRSGLNNFWNNFYFSMHYLFDFSLEIHDLFHYDNLFDVYINYNVLDHCEISVEVNFNDDKHDFDNSFDFDFCIAEMDFVVNNAIHMNLNM